MEIDEEVEKEYQEFWKDIVENEDGTLNKEHVKKELCDFSMVMDNCTKAYIEMTCNRISKPNTKFFEVLSIFEEKFLDKEYVRDDMRETIDKCSTLEELVEELTDYFEL
jgi:hypothetical protein